MFETTYTKVFARFENDDRLESYGDIPEYFTDEDYEVLEETFNRFDETLGPVLCQAAYEFYCEKLGKKA